MKPFSKRSSLAAWAFALPLGVSFLASQARAADANPSPTTPPSVTVIERPTATGKARLAVMDLDIRAAGLDPVIGESLSAVLAAELVVRAGDRYDILSRGDLRSLLRQQIDLQATGCSSGDCLRDISQLTDAAFMVNSSVARLGEELVLTLELVDIKAGTVMARQKATWAGEPAGLVELVRPYVARLVDGSKAEEYRGALEILASTEGAEVIVNDQKLGPTPLGALRDLDIGKHRVRLAKPGYLPYSADVVVNRNETTILQANLIDEASLEPWYAKWWVWTAAGAGAAAVATVIILVALPGAEPRELVVDQPLP